ncbi:MAG: hypothetical protein ACOCV0_00430 [Alkalispirochaeta sp.]
MGIFDTVTFEPPRMCITCGASISEVQTKAFDPGLREYRVGDVIYGSPLLNGVIREDLYCPRCNASKQKIYFSIWHTLLVGVHDDLKSAEERIGSVDRSELLDYLVQHQAEALQWHDRFSRLYGELQNFHDYQAGVESGNSKQRENPMFFRIREYVDAPDPLGELIRANKPVNPEDETEVSREEESS